MWQPLTVALCVLRVIAASAGAVAVVRVAGRRRWLMLAVLTGRQERRTPEALVPHRFVAVA